MHGLKEKEDTLLHIENRGKMEIQEENGLLTVHKSKMESMIQDKKTMKLLEQIQTTVTETDIFRIIRVNTLLKRPVEAQAAFDLFKKLLIPGQTPSVHLYNVLMDAYASTGDIFGASRVFKELRTASANSVPVAARTDYTSSASTFDTSITASALTADNTSANASSSTVVNTSKTSSTSTAVASTDNALYPNVEPNVFSYGIFIKACIAANDLSSAFKIYSTMKLRNVAPTLPIYTSLIKGCIHAGDLDRAAQVHQLPQALVPHRGAALPAVSAQLPVALSSPGSRMRSRQTPDPEEQDFGEHISGAKIADCVSFPVSSFKALRAFWFLLFSHDCGFPNPTNN